MILKVISKEMRSSLAAVKYLKEITGVGLREGKDIIDTLYQKGTYEYDLEVDYSIIKEYITKFRDMVIAHIVILNGKKK